jgi:hypothetical protein
MQEGSGGVFEAFGGTAAQAGEQEEPLASGISGKGQTEVINV